MSKAYLFDVTFASLGLGFGIAGLDYKTDNSCCSVSAGPGSASRLFRYSQSRLSEREGLHGRYNLFPQHQDKNDTCRRCQLRYAVKTLLSLLPSLDAVCIDSVELSVDGRPVETAYETFVCLQLFWSYCTNHTNLTKVLELCGKWKCRKGECHVL